VLLVYQIAVASGMTFRKSVSEIGSDCKDIDTLAFELGARNDVLSSGFRLELQCASMKCGIIIC